MVMFLQPRSLEGASRGICWWSGVRRPRPVPCKHGTRAARGSAPRAIRPSRGPLALADDATVMIATPSANAGTARSAGVRPRSATNAARSAEGRCVPSPRDAHATAVACILPGATSALRPSIFEGQGPALPRRETRRPPWRRPKAAADFAWLYDMVNRTRARLVAEAPAPHSLHLAPRAGRGRRAQRVG